MIRTTAFIIACLMASQVSFAGVLVKAKELGSGSSEIRIDTQWARLIDLSSPQQFMLVDMQKHISYMGDKNQKIMVRMEEMNVFPPDTQIKDKQAKPKVTLIRSGDGPVVAGFKTTRYQLKANNKLCSEHFISQDALKVPEIKVFAKSIELLAKSPQYIAEHQTPCEYADIEFEQMAFSKGIPLLSKNSKGKETFRVNEIRTNISFKPDEVAPPADYQALSAQQMMHRQMNRALKNQ